jgi:hypothetical protein
MITSDLGKKFGFRVVQDRFDDRELSSGYTSDLLSDVMGNAVSGSVLVTIQAHKNTVAVATLVGMAAIVICNDRPIPQDMVEAAKAEGVAIFATGRSQFEVSGLLWPELKAAGAN